MLSDAMNFIVPDFFQERNLSYIWFLTCSV